MGAGWWAGVGTVGVWVGGRHAAARSCHKSNGVTVGGQRVEWAQHANHASDEYSWAAEWRAAALAHTNGSKL